MIAPPPLIYLAFLGLGFALEALLPGADLPRWLSIAVGPALIAAGLGLAGWFVAEFRRASTAVDPYHATTAIVSAGPFRLTRNPGYVGMALVYAGIALAASAPWALVALPLAIAAIDRGVIAREERYLERKFGETYLSYKRGVRRWL